jgi:hypothetical protein
VLLICLGVAPRHITPLGRSKRGISSRLDLVEKYLLTGLLSQPSHGGGTGSNPVWASLKEPRSRPFLASSRPSRTRWRSQRVIRVKRVMFDPAPA